jgi:predicted Rossmann fold flavoprotein
MKNTDFDIAVIGGGAAGLAAGICAARRGCATAIVEGNPRTGKKLLVTGNGQGNIANAYLTAGHYNNDFAMKIFEKIPLNKLTEFFESAGIETVRRQNGRIYPLSMQASSVLDNLRQAAQEAGAAEICSAPVGRIEKAGDVFILKTPLKDISCKAAIVACGGAASPHLSCGGGYGLLTAFGHKKTKLLPSLVQIKTDKENIKGLKGVKISDVTISGGGGQAQGDIIFADYGISGSAVFEISPLIVRLLESGKNADLYMDLLPEISLSGLINMLKKRRNLFGGRNCEFLLNGVVTKQLIKIIFYNCGIDGGIGIKDIGDAKLTQIAGFIKKYHLKATGCLGLENAQVTIGGICTDDFDDNLMSKLCRNLYACGEILDIDGKCGGYNLMWAFCSGILCGSEALK